MKKRLYALLFIAALLSIVGLAVSLLVGLNHSGRDVTDRMDLVPETANLIGRVELSQMTGDGDIAEIYSALPKEAGDPQTIDEALKKALNMSDLDLTEFKECWIFSDVSRNTTDNYCGAILKGTFEESSLLASMESAVGEGFTSIDCQGHAIYTGSDQRVGLTILSDDLVVTGSLQAVKDVVAVSDGNMSAVSGELLNKYDALDGSLVKVAAAMPDGLIEQQVQELTAGITSPTALDALADAEIVTLDLDKDGKSIACSSQLFFSSKESANDVRGLIPLLSLVIGAVDLPGGSVIQHPQNVLALLPQLLAKSDFHTDGSRLTITSDLTVADIEAMSAVKERSGLEIAMGVNMGSLTESGLDVSIDAVIVNHIALNLDIGDLTLTTAMKDQPLTEETIAGGSIDANSTASFQHSIVIPLELLSQRELQITIDTKVEARGFSIPLSTSIALTTPDIQSLIVVPETDVTVNFGEVTADGLHMGLQAAISNSNPFGVDVGDVQVVATGQSGNVVFTSKMNGLSIGPDSTGTLSGDLLMPLEVLNESSIVITVQTQAGFAGVALPIGAKVTVNMPDIESLITIPTLDVGVDFGELTADGMHMGLQATITNPNPFGVDVGDVQVVARDQSGNVISDSNMKGLSIGPNSAGTLSGDLLMPLEVLNESTVVITVQTQAGFAGVTLPIGARLTVNMPDLASLITVPGIDLGMDFGELTSDGLHIGLRATITNPNQFGIDVGDVRIVATGESGKRILTDSMDGCSIRPGSIGTISGDLLMPLEVLNESAVVITVQTQAGFASVTLPISAKLTVNMPDIGSLISVPEIEMRAEASWVSDLPLPGLRIAVVDTMTNKGSIDLNIDDLQTTFYDSKGNYVVKMTIPGGTIRAASSKQFSGSVTLSALQYSRLLGGGHFTVTMESEASIGAVDAKFPFKAAVTIEMSSLLKIPELDFGVSFGKLTSDGLHLGLCTNLDNSNPFGIDMGDLLIVVTDASGNVIRTTNMKGLSIGAESTATLSGDLLIPLEALNGSTVVIAIQTQAGFAGITQPVNDKLTIKMPDIQQLITPPEVDFGVEFRELTPDGLHLGLQSNISNPNLFGIDIGELQVTARNASGEVILSTHMNGLSIGPNSTGTLSGDLLLPLDVVDRSTVVITVQTNAGFAGATLPISGRVTVKMPNVESLVTVPEIDLGVSFGELTSDGLRLALRADIGNSNPFGVHSGNLQITAKGQSGNVIFTGNIEGHSIDPGSTATFSADLLLPLEAIDEPTILLTVQTEAEFGGVALPIKAKIVLKMPGMKSLVAVPEMDLGVAVGELTPDGLHIALRADLANSNPFGVDVGNLRVVAKGQSGNVILTGNIDGCHMEPDSTVALSCDLLLPLEAMDEPTIVITVQTTAECDDITLAVNAKVVLVNMPHV